MAETDRGRREPRPIRHELWGRPGDRALPYVSWSPVTSTASIFTGVGVALITVFDDDGRVNFAETAEHAGRLVDEGVKAIVVGGTTGEAMSLDPDERILLLAAVRKAVGDRAPLIAGTGAPSARQAVEHSRRAAAEGADAMLVLALPGISDQLDYYERVASSVEVPILAYHFPLVSAPGIALEQLPNLPVVGLKDSSGDPDRLIREVAIFPDGVFVGRHSLLLHAAAIGCAGAILAIANLDPRSCLAAWDGDARAQYRLVIDHGDHATIPALKRRLAELTGINPAVRIG